MSDIQSIGRYRVSGLLGTGAFASVLRGHDDVLDAPVAIKVLADNWARHLDVSERFLAEARLLRQADSDRVLRVLDIGELPDGRPYFVTVLADRGSLADRLDRGELPTEEALAILVEVAEAVCVLHAMGVVHRDLKPPNVLIQSAGDGERVVLADLGLAKALAQGSGLTQVAGSPGYMAPEQARPGAIVDERTDVYGLGALAHRLLAGATPGERVVAPLPGRLGRAVRRALHTDPDRRWPTARAFADELRALSEHGWSTSRRRRLLPWAAAVGAIVLVASLFLWWQPEEKQVAAPVPPVNPALCRANELRVFDAGTSTDPMEYTRRGMSLFFESKQRRCVLFGRLQDVRFVNADGSVVPLRFGDGEGEPIRVELDDSIWAELEMSWSATSKDRGRAAVTPARLEFRLPDSLDLVTVPWDKGPVGDDTQVEIGPIRNASN
ncbi:serine/threonine-protein kinase [Allokutzneria oryzae]|uniref:non-specific serine/threonine protein kinase n=1 Tax=Allokutzneria oryzae TaxID=1378989 RepID=A0ABV6A1Q2_9PSEU